MKILLKNNFDEVIYKLHDWNIIKGKINGRTRIMV